MKHNPIIFKALLLFTTLTCVVLAKAQEPCEITCDTEMPICSGAEIVLSVPDNYQCSYQWKLNGSPISGQTNHNLRLRPTRPAGDNSSSILEMNYSVTIRDLDTDTVVCQSEPFVVGIMPIFKVSFRQLQLTCSNREEENGRTAQVIAWVDESSAAYANPFLYQWNVSPMHIAPGCDSLAIGLEAFRYYKIKVTDNRGCLQWDSVSLKAFLNPRIEISTDPGDTVYIQNPHVSYSFENQPFPYQEEGQASNDTLISVSNFYWVMNSTYNLTSTESEPRFTYVEEGSYTTELKVYNPQGCDTSYYKTIQVEPVKLKIPNVFTPNGDGHNDFFIIALDDGSSGGGSSSGDDSKGTRDEIFEYENYEPLSSYYESSELTIFNRWGRVVYHSKDYKNDWDGGGLSDGTYFYVLKCHGLKQDATYQGAVMIVTAQRNK